MFDYDYTEFQERWRSRYPEDVHGWAEWHAAGDLADWRAPTLPRRRWTPTGDQGPRFFISHKREDLPLARSVARRVSQAGFHYWLDAEDPDLQALGMSEEDEGIAIASVIEMALINSTHVIAITTKISLGSQWIPYEYGRVREDSLFSVVAASFLDSDITPEELPEYRHLGATIEDESMVVPWCQLAAITDIP